MTTIAAATAECLAGWASLLVGMALSFLYSGLETGTYAVNKIRLELRAESGSRRAAKLRAMLAQPGKPLTVVLIGNNAANYLASAGLVLILTSLGVARADWVSVAILTPLIFIFCELLPKNLFHRHGETLTYFFSGFLDLSRRLFTMCGVVGLVQSLVWLILKAAGRRVEPDHNPLGAGRFGSFLAEGRASGAITQTQSVIAERVVRLGQVHVGDVMVALDQTVLVAESAPVEQVRQILGAHGHPRLGVYRRDRENIVGILNAYDVLMDPAGAPPSRHVTEALRLPARTGVIDALLSMQKRRARIAFVTAEDDRCVGLVTIKDLVEEIVGELAEW